MNKSLLFRVIILLSIFVMKIKSELIYQGFNNETLKQCPTWSKISGVYIQVMNTNAQELTYISKINLDTNATFSEDNEQIVYNLIDTINLKSLYFEDKQYQYKESLQSVSNKTDVIINCSNTEAKQKSLYRWVYSLKIENATEIVNLPTHNFLCIEEKYRPKCPFNYCIDEFCQSCSIPDQQNEFCTIDQYCSNSYFNSTIISQCQQTNDKCSGCTALSEYTFLTKNYKCLKKFVQEKINCSQQLSPCSENKNYVSSIFIFQEQCIISQDKRTCSERQVMQVEYFVCCEKDPFEAHICPNGVHYPQTDMNTISQNLIVTLLLIFLFLVI